MFFNSYDQLEEYFLHFFFFQNKMNIFFILIASCFVDFFGKKIEVFHNLCGQILATVHTPCFGFFFSSSQMCTGADVRNLTINWYSVVVKTRRLQNNASSTYTNSKGKNPQEQTVQHHCNVLPIFFDLKNKKITFRSIFLYMYFEVNLKKIKNNLLSFNELFMLFTGAFKVLSYSINSPKY